MPAHADAVDPRVEAHTPSASTLEVGALCSDCRTIFTIIVDADRYHRWDKGEGNIQDLLPELSAGDRELLLTGTCNICFEKLFVGGKR